jgi:catechol 2,3-dioxygenase-like lactoylglutathione lyase family enzyme
MNTVHPHNFHRLALAVPDVDEAAVWLQRTLGAVPVKGSEGLTEQQPGRDLGNLAGTTTKMLWVGGYPVILLGGGAVARFLERHGPGVQSWAWEVDDNWEVEHAVRDRGIDVISPNLAGRFFFMQPKQTFGLLWEWCDGKMPRDGSQAGPTTGVVTVDSVAWITGVVADADAAADWVLELTDAELVEGNPAGPTELERTVDLRVGDITVRLVTPLAPESRYAPVLDRGPRVHSFALRVPSLDAALDTLAADGITTTYREGALAATDPSTTLGLSIDWTE